MQGEWSCHKHNEAPIVLVCTGNVWHFQGLCTNCVPEHTKNHPKNIKVQMEGIKQVLQKAIEIKKKVSAICQSRLQECQFLKKIEPSELEYVKILNDKRSQVVSEVNLIFDKMIEDTRKFHEKEQKSQQQSLSKLMISLRESIDFFKKEEYQNIEQFCRQIKKYYFKENLDVYVEQYDQIIKEYKQKVVNYTPFIWSKDVQGKCQNLVKDIHKANEPEQKKEKSQKSQVIKKQLKRKEPQKKKCGRCGQEMEYLTQWKKHLVCRNCGGKERNYVKK